MSGTLSGRSIITLNEAKDFLGIDRPDASLDDLLIGDGETNLGWIDLISGSIEDYIQNKVQQQEIDNEILDGSGTECLSTRYFPVRELAEDTVIEYRNTSLGLGEWADLLTGNDEVFIDSFGVSIEILGGTIFPAGRKNIRVSYVAGYSTIPGDIKTVCLEMLKVHFENSGKKSDRLGMASRAVTTAGQTSTDSFRSLKPEWKEVLDKYRKVSV